MKVIKTLLTIVCILICGCAGILAMGFYLSETNQLRYDVKYYNIPVILDASLTPLGKEYGGEEEEGYSFYRIDILLENQANVDSEEGLIRLNYEGTCNGVTKNYYVSTVREEREPDVWQEGYYFPAWKSGIFSQVIKVNDGCSSINLIMRSIKQKDDQIYTVLLN